MSSCVEQLLMVPIMPNTDNLLYVDMMSIRLCPAQSRYQAVVKLGCQLPKDVSSVQEEAERVCTAPYRAPELFDVASKCTIDERVDVWSLGELSCPA